MENNNNTNNMKDIANRQYAMNNNAPALRREFNWSKRIRPDVVRKYFIDLFETDYLAEGESARVTGAVPVYDKKTKETVIGYSQLNKIIRCPDDLLDHLTEMYNLCDKLELHQNEELRYLYKDDKKIPWHKTVQYSMSSSIFKVPVLDPNSNKLSENITIKHFDRTKTFVLDIDTHKAKKIDGHVKPQKERFNFNSYNTTSKTFILMNTIVVINRLLQNNLIDLKIYPTRVYFTGGGIQLHFVFDEWLNKLTAETAYNIFKIILSTLNGSQMLIAGRKQMDMQSTLKFAFSEFDTTSTDIIHTQRVAGLINPKEEYNGAFAEEFLINGNNPIFDIKTFMDATEEYKSYFDMSTFPGNTEKQEMEILHDYDSNISLLFNDVYTRDELLMFKKPIETPKEFSDRLKKEATAIYNEFTHIFNDIKTLGTTAISSKGLNTHLNIVKNIKKATFTETQRLNEYENAVESDILKQLTPQQQFEFMDKYLTFVPGQSEDTNGYRTYLCPFHDEDTPSFAVMKNENSEKKIALAVDFHPLDASKNEQKVFNCINLVRAIKQKHEDSLGKAGIVITKSMIIKELIAEFSIDVSKVNRKAMNEIEREELAAQLIDKVDIEHNIYYRKANKSKDCVIRELEEGTFVIFDGTRMLTDHVLKVQLKVKESDNALRSEFHDMFMDKIMMNAFEEYSPGMGYTFIRSNIQYVNTWVPNSNYNAIQELARSIDEMDVDSAIELIKQKLPTSYFFMLQMTQKGNLRFFVNLLASISKFEIMPNIPVVTSVQGTGKGVFVEHWLKYYLGSDDVNNIKSDALSNNFNAFMETSSMIVLDESDFSTTKEVDNLKFFSGNTTIPVEKKGVDTVQKKRNFNFFMLTNGDTPFKHPYNDRRVTYFRLEVPLPQAIHAFDPETYKEEDTGKFIDNLRAEAREFWAIITKTKIIKKYTNMNMKDNQYNKQILQMHPFGKMVIQLIDKDWQGLETQTTEGITDSASFQSSMESLKKMRNTFETEGYIEFTSVNKYIASLKYKTFIGVREFIKANNLNRYGITTKSVGDELRLYIDIKKVSKLIYMENNLGLLIDKFDPKNYEKSIENMYLTDIDIELEDESMSARTADGVPLHLAEKGIIPPSLDIDK